MASDGDIIVVDGNKKIFEEKLKSRQKQQMLNRSKDGTHQSGHHRKRKRHQFNAIRTQMEFYFGDANLSKDRFLRQLIDKDPYVPLEIFLSFNKIKALAKSVEDIAKSLSNSLLLEVDETQKKVRRKTALVVDRNVDEKTLYVESLPPTADHDWIRETFEKFGPVSYVSLPKYSKSRKIKEFAFVEFEEKRSLNNALVAFREFNGVLCLQATNPCDLLSVKAFINEQYEDSLKENESKLLEIENGIGKEGGDEPKAKRTKTEDSNSSNTSATEDKDTLASEVGTISKRDEKQKQQEPENEDNSAPKKNRHKKKKKSKKEKEADTSPDATYYELKVLPKKDWKSLRNKYLNLQREQISRLKRKAWKEQQEALQQSKVYASEVLDVIAHSPGKKVKSSEHKLQGMNMNFYGAGEEEPQAKMGPKQSLALDHLPLFSYEPGLIVKVSFMKPCLNVKEFKADMRQYSSVKYVDIKEGALHAYLRLESAVASDMLVRQVNCAEYKCKVLAGDDQIDYWNKITQDREMKLTKQVKVPQKRGREKIKKLAAKHTRFSDGEI